MTDLQVFGYGSLVNADTHSHDLTPARAVGWRRVWREIPGRAFAILSVTPDPVMQIDGAVMAVAATDLPALDAREALYVRRAVLLANGPANAVTYEVQDHAPAATKPILRSYLDVVLAGYEGVFGADSLAAFYASTDGWSAGILDDRAAPIYPRHQVISTAQAARYDALHRAMTAHSVSH